MSLNILWTPGWPLPSAAACPSSGGSRGAAPALLGLTCAEYLARSRPASQPLSHTRICRACSSSLFSRIRDSLASFIFFSFSARRRSISFRRLRLASVASLSFSFLATRRNSSSWTQKQNSCDHLGLNKDELQLERAPAPAPRSKPPDCSAWAGAEGSEDAQCGKCSSECPLCTAELNRTSEISSILSSPPPKIHSRQGQNTNSQIKGSSPTTVLSPDLQPCLTTGTTDGSRISRNKELLPCLKLSSVASGMPDKGLTSAVAVSQEHPPSQSL
ncbi:hypothetical protein DV515_00012942 [Chloebia gouldiae]|uniref:Uncharacterized protein n=1 Tax=Chloebia gouldiae TaxID=44316 RepID=A0A3L8S2H2_CHLGU|nr:hypothetical protein DV515_00012942 [Chloebia gouldiae]